MNSYFNFTKAQTLINGAECKSNNQCDSNKGLVCIKNVCQCSNSNLYWNNQICGTFFVLFLSFLYLNLIQSII